MSIDLKMTELANAIRRKANKTEKLTLDTMIATVQNLTIGSDDTTMEDALVTGGNWGSTTYTNSNITSIEPYAFYGKTLPGTVSFPRCTIVKSSAFGNPKFYSIYLPECITIEECAFSNATAGGGNIQTISIPKCITIGSSAFRNCYGLKNIDLPACETINHDAFASCSCISTFSAPKVRTIGNGAFIRAGAANDNTDGGYYFPMCETIGDGVFNECKAYIVSLPVCCSIGGSAFSSMRNLKEIYLPKASVFSGGYHFINCASLTSVDLPVCTSITSGMFRSCIKLVSVNIPMCSWIAYGAFESCTSLLSAEFPICTLLSGSYCFSQCTSLKTVKLPKCSIIAGYAFIGCKALETVSIPECKQLQRGAFYSCTSLQSLELPATSIRSAAFTGATMFSILTLTASTTCYLYNSAVFSGTLITNTTGSIFVPASLVEAYQKSTNWTYFKNRIFPIEEAT